MAHTHVFPWWAGYLLINPLRKLSLDPEKFLGEYVKEGMTVLDAGCAMGFFSLPMARMAGSEGRVICIDLQQRMLDTLRKRARRAGLDKRIDARVCSSHSLMAGDLTGQVDFALAFGVVHEVPDRESFITELHRTLNRGGRLLIGEPKGPVSKEHFRETIDIALHRGLSLEMQEIKNSFRYALFKRD